MKASGFTDQLVFRTMSYIRTVVIFVFFHIELAFLFAHKVSTKSYIPMISFCTRCWQANSYHFLGVVKKSTIELLKPAFLGFSLFFWRSFKVLFIFRKKTPFNPSKLAAAFRGQSHFFHNDWSFSNAFLPFGDVNLKQICYQSLQYFLFILFCCSQIGFTSNNVSCVSFLDKLMTLQSMFRI